MRRSTVPQQGGLLDLGGVCLAVESVQGMPPQEGLGAAYEVLPAGFTVPAQSLGLSSMYTW